MKDENECTCRLNQLNRWAIIMNVVIIITLALIGALGVKDLINTTKTTKALSEVAQKAGVEFPTKTNNVLGVWQVVKPK